MCKKFLSANLILMITFCSVNADNPPTVEKYKRAADVLREFGFKSSKQQILQATKVSAAQTASQKVSTANAAVGSAQKIPQAPPPPAVKKAVVPAQTKSAVDEIKDKAKKVVDSFKSTKVGQFIFKPKTMADQIKEANLKKEVAALQKKQADAVLKQDPLDMGPMDKIFNGVGGRIGQAFPKQVKALSQFSMKMQSNSLSKFSKKVNEDAQGFKDSLYDKINNKIVIKDTDIDSELTKRINDVNAEIKKQAQAKLEKDYFEKLKKDITQEFKNKGITADTQKIEEEVKKRMVYVFSAAEKTRAELAVRDDVIKSMRDQIKSDLTNQKLETMVADRLKQLQQNPDEYNKRLAKIGKDMGMSADQIKNILNNPTSATDKMRRDMLEDAFREDLKDGVKKTLIGRLSDFSNDLRSRSQSIQVIAIASICSLVVTQLIKLAQKLIVPRLIDSGDEKGKQAKSSSETKAQQTGPVILVDSGKSSADSEAALLDGAGKVIDFYTSFDEHFKSILNKFSYNDRIFNAGVGLKYSGGVVNAGAVLLFDYEGAGNIANRLTPMIIKMYPEFVGDQAVSIDSVMSAVGNTVALELMGALKNNSPDLIFTIKALSLLNYANKKYTDATTRNDFLRDELDKLFVRLTLTVDDAATSRSNALEPDQDKWESIYVKEVSSCLINAPECIRDILKDKIVSNLTLAGGNTADVQYEQYMIDRFEVFKVLKTLPFEGDVDYSEDLDFIKSTDIKQILFAIFLRALDDVLILEKDLAKNTQPITLKDINGKEDSFVGKTFYEQVTKDVWSAFQDSQSKYVDAIVEFAVNVTDKSLAKKMSAAEKAYFAAAKAYDSAALSFRKKVCMYEFDRTQGLESESVLDFLVRELKRYYILAKDKASFEADLLKSFEPFAQNFPFTGNDLLTCAKDPSPIKAPKQKVIAEVAGQDQPEATDSSQTAAEVATTPVQDAVSQQQEDVAQPVAASS